MKALNIVSILIGVFLIGCATHTQNVRQTHEEYTLTERQGMHAWKGQHISEVVKKWGQPYKITEQNSGGKIYTWKHTIGITTFPDGKLRGRLDTLIPIINLYTHDDGIVYHWTSDAGSRAVRPR